MDECSECSGLRDVISQREEEIASLRARLESHEKYSILDDMWPNGAEYYEDLE